jgi:mono/diheme cytochrome c family protein
MEAATLYAGIPATNVTRMTGPAQAVADAIEAKDRRRFAKAFAEFTNGCNACHQSIGRGFIVMRVPTESPFKNQMFPRQVKP